MQYLYINEIFKRFKKKEKSVSRATVRRWAIAKKVVPYACAICGNEGHWQGLQMPLELHHCNGNNKDHRPENLAFLCPNCHSQTLSWRRKK